MHCGQDTALVEAVPISLMVLEVQRLTVNSEPRILLDSPYSYNQMATFPSQHSVCAGSMDTQQQAPGLCQSLH